MISLTAALVVALSLGAGDGRARKAAAPGARVPAGATLSNSERARVGLLPRKPSRKVGASARRRPGMRILTVSHQPTFLGEPLPIAEAPPEPAGAPAPAEPALLAPEEVRDLRLAASSVVTDVTLVLRYAP